MSAHVSCGHLSQYSKVRNRKTSQKLEKAKMFSLNAVLSFQHNQKAWLCDRLVVSTVNFDAVLGKINAGYPESRHPVAQHH